ncbi:hypothetical protein [Mucilaginibacter sp. L196]|uniref:hypothetical protein n=1 Tax=Mucilaginibacter sp. L196 TaxID=1641870 RepID=UPI00131B41FB|nr:hypothetical protein [Mucilaginibacter sp. L196]
MDLTSLYTIVIIIAAIIILEFYKRERDRVTVNLHTNNLKHLLTITALEYKHTRGDTIKDNEPELVDKKISSLVNSYEKGEIQNSVLQKKVYSLLKS